MKKDIAELWTAALRSGDYEQGCGVLHDTRSNMYCCLGVLCDLAVKAGVVTEHEDGTYGDDEETYDLPDEVMEWSGMRSNYGRLPMGELGESLIDYNDIHEYDFDQIADVIDEHWEGL